MLFRLRMLAGDRPVMQSIKISHALIPKVRVPYELYYNRCQKPPDFNVNEKNRYLFGEREFDEQPLVTASLLSSSFHRKFEKDNPFFQVSHKSNIVNVLTLLSCVALPFAWIPESSFRLMRHRDQVRIEQYDCDDQATSPVFKQRYFNSDRGYVLVYDGKVFSCVNSYDDDNGWVTWNLAGSRQLKFSFCIPEIVDQQGRNHQLNAYMIHITVGKYEHYVLVPFSSLYDVVGDDVGVIDCDLIAKEYNTELKLSLGSLCSETASLAFCKQCHWVGFGSDFALQSQHPRKCQRATLRYFVAQDSRAEFTVGEDIQRLNITEFERKSIHPATLVSFGSRENTLCVSQYHQRYAAILQRKWSEDLGSVHERDDTHLTEMTEKIKPLLAVWIGKEMKRFYGFDRLRKLNVSLCDRLLKLLPILLDHELVLLHANLNDARLYDQVNNFFHQNFSQYVPSGSLPTFPVLSRLSDAYELLHPWSAVRLRNISNLGSSPVRLMFKDICVVNGKHYLRVQLLSATLNLFEVQYSAGDRRDAIHSRVIENTVTIIQGCCELLLPCITLPSSRFEGCILQRTFRLFSLQDGWGKNEYADYLPIISEQYQPRYLDTASIFRINMECLNSVFFDEASCDSSNSFSLNQFRCEALIPLDQRRVLDMLTVQYQEDCIGGNMKFYPFTEIVYNGGRKTLAGFIDEEPWSYEYAYPKRIFKLVKDRRRKNTTRNTRGGDAFVARLCNYWGHEIIKPLRKQVEMIRGRGGARSIDAGLASFQNALANLLCGNLCSAAVFEDHSQDVYKLFKQYVTMAFAEKITSCLVGESSLLDYYFNYIKHTPTTCVNIDGLVVHDGKLCCQVRCERLITGRVEVCHGGESIPDSGLVVRYNYQLLFCLEGDATMDVSQRWLMDASTCHLKIYRTEDRRFNGHFSTNSDL